MEAAAEPDGGRIVAWKETESVMGRNWAKFALVAALVLFGGTLLVQEARKTIDVYRQQLARPSDLFMAIDWKTMAEQEAAEEELVDELLPVRSAGAGNGAIGTEVKRATRDVGEYELARRTLARRIEAASVASVPVEPLAFAFARAMLKVAQGVEYLTAESVSAVTTLAGMQDGNRRAIRREFDI